MSQYMDIIKIYYKWQLGLKNSTGDCDEEPGLIYVLYSWITVLGVVSKTECVVAGVVGGREDQ